MKRNTFWLAFVIALFSSLATYAQQTETVSVNGAGWKRIAAVMGSTGRGFGRISLFTTGGSYTPYVTSINWFHNWNDGARISVWSDSPVPAFWNAVRITDDGTNAYIEVNFTTSLTNLTLMVDDYGWRPATMYTNILPDGGGSVRATADVQRVNIGNNFVVSFDGNVGIGTTNPQGYKLAVNGNMITESLKVKLQGTWPDFVFAKDYKLPSLKETEKHIKENGHLPGIPSAAEVKENGVELGEMNKKLLQKIEELTLYLIELKKENENMRSDIRDLKTKVIKP